MKPKILSLIAAAFCALPLASCTTNPATGQPQFDPAKLEATAKAEAHDLIQEYLTTGKIHYKADLISGALGQLRTIEGTALPFTNSLIASAVARVVTDPGMRASIADAVVRTYNDARTGGIDPDVALERALSLLDKYVQSGPTSSP